MAYIFTPSAYKVRIVLLDTDHEDNKVSMWHLLWN